MKINEIPLMQWKCDLCGKLIVNAKNGRVIWKENYKGQIDIILIVHNHNADHEDCVKFKQYNSVPLQDFLGYQGIIKILSLAKHNSIANPELFLDFYRRTQVKYYEEAKLFWDNETSDSFVDSLVQTLD